MVCDTMKCVISYGINDMRVEEISLPKISDDEILVKVKASGICFSDLLGYKGKITDYKFPVIMGHEIVGDVYNIGKKVSEFDVDERVTLYPISSCMKCSFCINGKDKFCKEISGLGHNINGGYAEFVKVPSNIIRKGGVIKLPNNLSYEEATFVEPLACCLNGLKYTTNRVDENVLIFGAGPIGQLLLQLYKLKSAKNIIILDPIKYRREMAQFLGANLTVNPYDKDIMDKLKEDTVDKIDIIIIATNNYHTVLQSIELLKKGGILNIFSMFPSKPLVKIDLLKFHYKELMLVAPWSLSLQDYVHSLEIIKSKKIILKPLISFTFSLNEIHKAFSIIEKGRGIKSILTL